MRKKFDKYVISVDKTLINEIDNVTFTTFTLITGDIEIGISIDEGTWRADWLSKTIWGADAPRYRLLRVKNNFQNETQTINKIIAFWEKK